MKKHVITVLAILLCAIMICACTGTPSTSTESGVDDTSNSTNSDTNDSTNDDSTSDGVGGNTNDDNVNDDATNDDNMNDDTTNDDNTNDGENGNVNGDGSNDNGDGSEENDANDNTNNGANGDLGNEEPPKEESPQVNIATQINDAYYKRIYGRYKGDDFPTEYGTYYKVISTYEEFKELFSTTDNVGRAFFNNYYAVVIYEHYQTFNHSTFVGYRDWDYNGITAVYCDADNTEYPEGSYIKDTKNCIAVPKSKLPYSNNGEIREINVTTDSFNGYEYDVEAVPTEKAERLRSGDAWLIKSNEELKEFCELYGIYKKYYNFEYGNIYVFAFFSDMYCKNYIDFREFYTDGKNVYITCEKAGTLNPSSEEKPSIYFVKISKEIIEHEMSENLVMHFLLQKSETVYNG